VGEIRRVLNSFLQFLDADDSASLIVAASNHPQLLDRAVFRRFDAVVEYPLPTPAIARDVIKQRLSSLGTKGVVWRQVDAVTPGLSHAELTLACEHAAKEALLSGLDRVTTGMLVSALKERRHAAGG
jgi:SpoVK/Ycf46/Vps4 family AAA+-type ATPase